MTVSFELQLSFLEREDLELSVEDLQYGYDRGWIHGPAIIGWAAAETQRGNDDPALLEIASIPLSEAHLLSEVLGSLDTFARIHDPRDSARKWLYLELKAAFESRGSLKDPLGVVELLYGEFDYPPTISGFIRYMPLQPGADAGEDALLQRWEEFLVAEHEALRRR